jgi:phosphate transport system protein
MKTHTDRAYEGQLRKLREQLLLMGAQIEEMIGDAIKALVECDVPAARKVIDADHRVNRLERETDELCLVILAKRQPLASDLRFITLALKMVTDLERIGDIAVNIAERAIDLSQLPPLKPYEDIPRMATVVQGMLRDAIDAFVSSDVSKAKEVIARDHEVDALYTQVFRDLLALMVQKSAAIERGIHVQSVAKWLERMGDHVTNLAEQVIFYVLGQDVRHGGRLE